VVRISYDEDIYSSELQDLTASRGRKDQSKKQNLFFERNPALTFHFEMFYLYLFARTKQFLRAY